MMIKIATILFSVALCRQAAAARIEFKVHTSKEQGNGHQSMPIRDTATIQGENFRRANHFKQASVHKPHTHSWKAFVQSLVQLRRANRRPATQASSDATKGERLQKHNLPELLLTQIPVNAAILKPGLIQAVVRMAESFEEAAKELIGGMKDKIGCGGECLTSKKLEIEAMKKAEGGGMKNGEGGGMKNGEGGGMKNGEGGGMKNGEGGGMKDGKAGGGMNKNDEEGPSKSGKRGNCDGSHCEEPPVSKEPKVEDFGGVTGFWDGEKLWDGSMSRPEEWGGVTGYWHPDDEEGLTLDIMPPLARTPDFRNLVL